MKLELKHIAPYLPYDLQVTLINRLFGGDKLEYEHNQSIDRVFMDYGFVKLHTEPYSNQGHLNEYLLQLRPMSDLTKEITHNGKTFVPARVLWSVNIEEEKLFDLFGEIPNYWTSCIHTDTKNYDYQWIQKLLEWHFDIFNLIPNKLAIPKP